jgi:Tol biopolymer transport system component
MKQWRYVWTVVAIAAFSAVVMSQTPSGHALFEQALAKERVEGNLPEAIKLFERVVTEFASDRTLAARALVQIGLSYEKLGRDEAVRAYERLMRDFADQEDAVELARVRLAVLKRPAPGAAAATTTPEVRPFPMVRNNNTSLSPDGTKAAFLSMEKGQNLAVYDVVSQQTTELTSFDWTPGSSWVAGTAWSPDGRRIAYGQCSWQNRCELRVATLTGGSTLISRNEEGTRTVPSGWLPDGSALVVMILRADRTLAIGVLPATGGPFTQLRSLSGWASQYPETPSVSPDGRLIAFVDGSAGMRDVHVISRDGRTAHRITDQPADDHRPLWSPDGRHLAFLSNRNGGAALWTVAVKDGQPAGEPVRIKEVDDVANLLGWTTRGLVYSQYLRSDDIYTVAVDPSNGEPRGIPTQVPYRRTGRNAWPVWSPDGKYLAFVSSAPAEPDRRAVILLSIVSGETREFPIPTSVYGGPTAPSDLRWFGNSSGLGFSGFDAKGERILFRLTLATAEWKTSPLPPWLYPGLEWNDDGSRFFFVRPAFQGGDTAIVEYDLQSERDRIIFSGAPTLDSIYRGLMFSPDRRSLAFRRGGEQRGFWVADVDTGRARSVLTDSDSDQFPTWSPNGRALLVARTENAGTERETTELRLTPVDGNDVRQIPLGAELTRLLSSGRGAPRPTIQSVVWSPDGSRLAFALRASRVESFVIENPVALAGAADASARK